MRYRNQPLMLLLGIMLAAASALAQSGPARLRGTIDRVNAESMDMTTRAGSKVHVLLPPNVRTTFVVSAKMTDIEPGSYIGTAATRESDGTLRAMEVHVFPRACAAVARASARSRSKAVGRPQ